MNTSPATLYPRLSHYPFRTGLLAACIALMASLVFLPRPALAQEDGLGQLGPQAQAIAQSINLIRSQNGLGPLKVHPLLNQAAQNHVDDLIANGMYGHYGSDGSNVRTRVLRTGYASGLVSENWVTSGSSQSAMDWWMNDWIHKVNILDSSWDEMGVGVGQVGNGYFIYVTDFANADGKDTSVAVTPPAEVQSAAGADYASEVLPAEGLDYTVRGGDTLLAIGLRYGIEWQDIAQANNMGEQDILSIGRTLRIPGLGAVAGSASAEPAAGGLLYTVKSGDTLITIAKRYAIDWNDIAAANRLSDFSVLQIGMQLRLPGVAEEGEEEDAAPVAASKSATAAVTVVQSSSVSYVVRAGDTLYGVAVRNNVTWQALAEINGLDEDSLIQIGQKLQLPAVVAAEAVAEETAAPAALDVATAPVAIQFTTELLPVGAQSVGGAAPGGRTYTVQPGDTVISIAVRNNMNWKELLRINGLDDNTLLQPGQTLVLGD